jgi:hypothetical protein
MEQNKEEKSKVANPMSHVEFESKMGIYIGTVAANGSLSGPVSEKIISLAYEYANQFKEQRDELLKASETIINHLNKTAAALGENIYNKIMESNKVKTLDSIIAKAKGGING